MDATAIILAAGEGTRMKSNHCKVSHKILGKPMVQWIVDATIKAGCSRVVVVIGSHADEMRALIDGVYANSATKVECVEQTERLGTGHAVKVALEACGITQGPVVVLNGDLPLITADTVAKFAQTVATGELACTVMTMTPPDPFGYGRIKLGADGQIERIIEQKDCTPEQAATLLECNAGCYAFDGAQLAASQQPKQRSPLRCPALGLRGSFAVHAVGKLDQHRVGLVGARAEQVLVRFLR